MFRKCSFLQLLQCDFGGTLLILELIVVDDDYDVGDLFLVVNSYMQK